MKRLRSTLLPAFGLAFALACAGCGEKTDYSGTGEASKTANPTTTPSPPAGGGSVGAAPTVSVPAQSRPDGK